MGRPTLLTKALTTLLVCAAASCALVKWEDFTSGTVTETGGGDSGADAGSVPDPVAPDAAADGGDAYAAVVLADRPVAYFRFEEAPGSLTATDQIAQKVALPAAPAVFGATGIAGGHGVELHNQRGFDVGDFFDFSGKVPFALEAWIDLGVLRDADQRVFDKRSDDLLGYIVYVGNDRTPHFEAWGVPMSAWSGTPVPQGFSHVVVSISYASGKGNATMWINDKQTEFGGFDSEQDLPATTAPFVIGRNVVGVLDEVAVYDHELAPERVRAHYIAGVTGR